MAVVIVNYRTADVTIEALASLAPETAGLPGLRVVVVDNASGDDSPDRIHAAIADRGWDAWAKLLRAPGNDGFSAGNNHGIDAIDAEAYLLLNSDTIVRPGAIAALHDALAQHPQAGLISPRLEWPDGTPQVSCFRWLRPATELALTAKTRPVSAALARYEPAMPIDETHGHPAGPYEWTSFACVLVRRAVFDAIGPMDDGYFMYFEDVDFCRTAKAHGFDTVHVPAARVVHLRGGSSPVKELQAQRKPRPRYFFAARSRYYAKHHGRFGLLRANVYWHAGRCVSKLREVLRTKRPHVCEREWRDIWTNFTRPLEGPHR